MKESRDKDLDYDGHSLTSMDLEEAKAMLQDHLDQAAYTTPTRKKRGTRTCVQVCSISVNIFLFLFLLAVLHSPCQFSSQSCTYTTSDGLILMSEEHGYVPECKRFRSA
jgi:hypothetical protein